MKQIVRRALRLPLLRDVYRKVLVPRHEGAWLYSGSILDWMNDEQLRNQLPLHYRSFGRLAQLNGRIWSGPIPAGSHLFNCVRWVDSKIGEGVAKLEIDGTVVWLDLSDPRMLNVPNELRNNESDAQLLKHWLQTGDTFIDVGANHGSFSIAAAALIGADGCIIAVEPQPKLAPLVRRSLEENASCSFVVYQLACSNVSGSAEFFRPSQSSGAAGLFATLSGGEEHESFSVELARFDDLELPPLSGNITLKLDVEGSEYNFLEGASRFLTECRPALVMELNPVALSIAGVSSQQLVDRLSSFGYSQTYDLNGSRRTEIMDLDVRQHRNLVFVPDERKPS